VGLGSIGTDARIGPDEIQVTPVDPVSLMTRVNPVPPQLMTADSPVERVGRLLRMEMRLRRRLGSVTGVGAIALLVVLATTAAQCPLLPMVAPAGYSPSQLIFEDRFTGSALDSSKWTTYLGSNGGVWNDGGVLPLPYSGPTAGHPNVAMYGPGQVSVNNGLTLTAQRNTNKWAGTYPWISGIVTTEGKFSLPAGGWYVQVKAQLPDMSQGMWPAIWFMPDKGRSPVPELDQLEGGMLCYCNTPQNKVGSSNYFAPQGQLGAAYGAGTDLTQGMHVYGFEFRPGVSASAFVDGRMVWQVTASHGVTIVGGSYQLMLELEVAGQNASGWHTTTSPWTSAAAMRVAEVQVYALP
jgi:Glycosyl hydrolases family 16